jgi:hypothetical protein
MGKITLDESIQSHTRFTVIDTCYSDKAAFTQTHYAHHHYRITQKKQTQQDRGVLVAALALPLPIDMEAASDSTDESTTTPGDKVWRVCVGVGVCICLLVCFLLPMLPSFVLCRFLLLLCCRRHS